MADVMDLAQQREQEDRVRNKIPRVSRINCIDCNVPVPPARRSAFPGVQCCVTCKEIVELKGKHYIGVLV